MRNRGVVAALVVATAVWGASLAGAATLEKGTVEFIPSLGFNRHSLSFNGADLGTLTNFNADGFVGYCITNHFELGGGLLVNYDSFDNPFTGSENSTSIGFTGGAQYNFSSGGQTIPFARAAIGVVTNSGSFSALGEETTVIAPMLQAGLRLLVGSSASVNCGVGYQHHSNAFGGQDVSSNTFDLEVGLSVFLRRGR